MAGFGTKVSGICKVNREYYYLLCSIHNRQTAITTLTSH